jgi:para-aminobenzoate synthetase component 1
MTETLIFENGPGWRPAAFGPVRRLVVAREPAEVAPALQALDAARAEGGWIAGFAGYELGYVLEPRLAALLPGGRRVPLLAFAVCDGPQDAAPLLAEAERCAETAGLTPPVPLWTAAEHGAAARRVLDWIAAGDIYQANLTFPLSARWSGGALGLYGALRRGQAVPHGGLIALPGCPAILSRSPELFFAIDDGGAIRTRPMKGTAPRGRTPGEDEGLKAALKASVKDRAENLMIVDLLRNDLSRIAAPGSVAVPRLFEVETYATVHQMVSEVRARLAGRPGLRALLAALFPCGSVTGAPKIRAMEIIRALEVGPRGAYCGAMGWMAPDGSAAFNVAIRTLTLYEGGEAEVWVGGGVVHDSTPAGEYQEALWKARFARPVRG